MSRGKLLRSVAAPYLMPGDKIEAVAVGATGRLKVKPNGRQLGILMLAFAAAIALGGGMIAYMRPSGRVWVYFVLTDRRLLMFRRKGPDGVLQYAASVPRADAATSMAKRGLVRLHVQLDVAPPAKGSTPTIRIPSMRVTFGKVGPFYRRTGRALFLALQDTGQAASSPART